MFASTPDRFQMLRISDVDGNSSSREASPTGFPQRFSLLPALLAPQTRATGPSLSGKGARGAVVLPGSFREKIWNPVSCGGCMAASVPQPATQLPMPGPLLLWSRCLRGRKHGAGLLEWVSAPFLLSPPRWPRCSSCQAKRPRAGSHLLLRDLFSFNHFN